MLPEYYFDYCPYAPMEEYSRQQNPQQMQPSSFQDNFEQAPGAPTTLGVEYTQGYLKTQIGKRVRVTFLIGTNTIQDRVGILEDVGISYIILREIDTNVATLGDIYSIKFVDIYPK